MGKKGKNKNAPGADGLANANKIKKERGGMSDKQGESKTETLVDLKSSSAWDRDDAEDDATREADDIAETSEEPIESTPTIEQTQDVAATEPVKNDDPQGELPQQEPDIAETELPWTTTPSTQKKKARKGPDSEDVSSDARPNSKAPTNAWSFGKKDITDVAESQDAGQPQDATNSQYDLGDKFQHISLGSQTLQEDLKVTDGEEKQGTIVTTDNLVRYPKVEDEEAPGDLLSDESSAPLEAHRTLSPPPPKQKLGEIHEPSEDQGNKARASMELPAQKPKHNDRLGPPIQEIVKQPATAQPLSDKPHLLSKTQTSIQVQHTQIPPPAQLQQPSKSKAPTQVQHTQTPLPAQSSKSKASIQAQKQLPAQSQEPNKPKTSVQAQGTQTESWTLPLAPVKPKNPTQNQGTQTEPWFEPQPPAQPETVTREQGAQTQVLSSSAPEPKSHGRAEPPLREILKNSTASPSASTGPQNQGRGFPYGRPVPQSNDLAQSSENQRSLEPERNNHGTARSTHVNGPANGTPLGRSNVPATPPVRSSPDPRNSPQPNPTQARPVQPDTSQPMPADRRLSQLIRRDYPILGPDSRAILSRTPGSVVELYANYRYDRVVKVREHTLARNTDYFSANVNRDAGRLWIHFAGEQFSHRVVNEYVLWLDRGVLPTMAALGRLTPSTSDKALKFLARAYIFGEVIEDRRWMNDVMDAFIHVHIHDWRLEIDDVILYTYEFSRSNSRLRTFLVDMFAYLLPLGGILRERLEDLPLGYFHAVRYELRKKKDCTPSCWRARLDHPSHYYVDEEGEDGLSWRRAPGCGHDEATSMR